MPNNCQNRLIVEGPAADVGRFRAQAAEGVRDDGRPIVFGIRNFVPEPPEGDPRRHPSSTCEGGWDWHSWRCDNWGTKWDVYDVALDGGGPEVLAYRFESAWAPPTEGVRRIAMAYPRLTLTLIYMEAGMQFYGHIKFRDEAVLEQEQRKYEDALEYDEEDEVSAVNDPILKAHVEAYGFGFTA